MQGSENTERAGAQNGGTPAKLHQAKPSKKKTTSTNSPSRQKVSTKTTTQDALKEERRKTAEAQATVENCNEG